MRIFRLMILLPILLCTTGAFATPACWEIKSCSGSACQLSASSDTPSDRRYFRCGGNGGCASGAIIYVAQEYYKCNSSKWVKLTEDKLSEELSNVRECGDSNADNEHTVQVFINDDTYDFFRENKSGTYLDKSDICKKPKTGAGAGNNPKPVEKSKPTTTVEPVAATEQKTEEPVVIEPAPVQHEEATPSKEKAAPATTSTPAVESITISGTVVDDTGVGLPYTTIVVSGSDIHTIADIDGNFTIQPTSLNDKLEFRFVGFEPVTISVADAQNTPKIVLTGTNKLAEVTTAVCKNLDEEIDPKTGKCVKTKSADEEKEEKTIEPTYEQKASTDETSYTPSADELAQKLKSAQDALAAAHEKENSWANRGVTAASSAMTGLGGMQLAEGIAERRADAEAEKEMRAYIETMKCEYGNGQNVKLGNEEITLPGGNELLDYYTEYKQLADNLKTTKSALGLRSGIESEVLYDRAQSGLYQYASIGKTGGAETSLYRALTDKKSEDAAAWAEQKDAGDKKLKVGGGVAAGGVGAGLLGDAAINTDMIKNIKEVFKK